jgi:hypothetical protein
MRVFLVIFFMSLGCPISALAQGVFIQSAEGDHYFYRPSGEVRDVLVIAHGTLIRNTTAQETAHRYLTRWSQFSEESGLALVVPVFDNARFGNQEGGYGGYRGLFGKIVAADDFVTALVHSHQLTLGMPQRPFYLYGHSAGGQFAIRFLVQHPELIVDAVVTAPGRFSYPTTSTGWPYGARQITRNIVWNDGTRQSVNRAGDLRQYAQATSKIHVIVGSEDLAPQPTRPAHIGDNRIELAQSWVRAMNLNALRYGFYEDARIEIISGSGHNSIELTLAAQNYLQSRISLSESSQPALIDN